MLKIEIRDGTAREETGRTKAGTTFTQRLQEGWVQLNGETRRVRIRLSREQNPYAPGAYVVSDDSFMVGQYNDLTIGRLVLRPVAAAAAVASR